MRTFGRSALQRRPVKGKSVWVWSDDTLQCLFFERPGRRPEYLGPRSDHWRPCQFVDDRILLPEGV